MKNIFHLFCHSVEKFASRPFLRTPQKTWTYEDMYKKVSEVGKQYDTQGLCKGHRVLYQGYNSQDFVSTMLAVWSRNAMFVPVSPDLSCSTIQLMTGLVRPFGSPRAITDVPRGFRGDDLGLVLFTSGTTAFPKGVVLSHENIMSNLQMIHARIPESVVSENDTSFSFLPWFHSYGLVCELLFLMSRGASLHLANSKNPKEFIKEMRSTHPTLLFTVPRLLDKIKSNATHQFWWMPSFVKKYIFFGKRLRYICTGGAPCEPSIMEYYSERWCIPVFQGYGLTETSPMVSLASMSDGSSSCGAPLEGIETRIDDHGVLHVKGKNVSQGYLDFDNRLSKPVDKFLDDGWFSTGDSVAFDAKHRLVFRRRQTGLWKLTNGKFVDPGLLERHVQGLPEVDQVAIIGNEKDFLKAVVFASRPCRHDILLDKIHNLLVERGFQKYEIPKEVILLQTPFSVSEGTLSIKQEPIRHVIQQMYYNNT